MNSHKLETDIGLFEFGWARSTGNWWIWGRFDEPKEAKKIYNCNPYTGKYNFHGYWLGSSIKELINHLEDMKERGLL